MTSIDTVSTYLPPDVVPIEELAGLLGLEEVQIRVYRRFYGLSEVRRDSGGTLTDLLLGAAGKLTTLRGQEHRVKYVLHARSVQTIAPYPVNPLHEVQRELHLEHALAFAVTEHACASGLLAVDLAGKLLASDGDPEALALVLAGDKAFTPAVQHIPGSTVMGEGSAAVLVRADGRHDRMLGYATHTHGQFHEALRLPDDLAADFDLRYLDRLAEVVLAAVETAEMPLSELALLLPHNINRVSWVRLCKRIGYPLERVLLDNIGVTGHCFCADPFINYETARSLDRLATGDRYLMTSVGLGATFSAMVFER